MKSPIPWIAFAPLRVVRGNAAVFPPDAKVEATFFVLGPTSGNVVRQPPPELAGIKFLGDVVAPAIEPDDWALAK